MARLQAAVYRLANAERDLAETNLVLEQQDRDLERLRAGLRERQWSDGGKHDPAPDATDRLLKLAGG